jgi:Serine carboxypeptidase
MKSPPSLKQTCISCQQAHSISIDSGVKAGVDLPSTTHSGYLSIDRGGAALFYVYYAAREVPPENAPVLLWLQVVTQRCLVDRVLTKLTELVMRSELCSSAPHTAITILGVNRLDALVDYVSDVHKRNCSVLVMASCSGAPDKVFCGLGWCAVGCW